MRIVTHSGIFHADEVMAIALLQICTLESLEIIRTRDIPSEMEETADFIIDVGGKYDGETWFDHHHDDSLPASNMLVLEYLVQKDYVSEEMFNELSPIFERVSDIDINSENIHQKRAEFDLLNGGITYDLNRMVGGFNGDPRDDAAQLGRFQAATEMMKIILANEIAKADERLTALRGYNNSVHELTHKVILLDTFSPVWKDVSDAEVHFAVLPNPQGWSITAKNTVIESLPSWIKEGNDGCTFVHNGRFIAVFKEKINAIAVAKRL